jgi:hypothetical protein
MQMLHRTTFSVLPITRYEFRAALASIVLAALTLAAIVFAPQVSDVTVIAQTPERAQVPLDSPISITFSRPVDQRSAARFLVIYPLVQGRFTWNDDRTIVFTPTEPLRPKTIYHITIRPGLRDTRGRSNLFQTVLSFRTR